jgi:uracil-DNA glycosylase
MMDNLEYDPLEKYGTRIVHPIGDGTSGIFFIGEAPGEKEDQQGEPFVGASGKLLNDTLLPSIGLSRQTIYLTNIVKRRPPENRDPTDEEKSAWSVVLMAELDFVKPKLIVCLGRHSLGFFVEGAKISKIHGQVQEVEVFENERIPVMPLYHPAVALYNPKMKEVLMEDFLKIKDFIRSIEQAKVEMPKQKNNETENIVTTEEKMKVNTQTLSSSNEGLF